MGTSRIVPPLAASWLALGFPRCLPAAPVDSLRFALVTAGATHTCALTTGGRAYCWGDNSEGELGDGTRIDSPVPVPVAGGVAFLSIDAGVEISCGIATTLVTYCWGRNSTSALGNAATPRSLVPAPVTGGELFRTIAVGADHACALADEGVVHCWGANEKGQLGTGDTVPSPRPLPVARGWRFVSLTAGDAHTCGIAVDSLAYCWGSNHRGELGISGRRVRLGPRPVAHHRRWRTLSAGAHHTCGITADRHPSVFCWGDNFHEQINSRRGRAGTGVGPLSLGEPILWAPTFVALSAVVAVSAGRWHTCFARGRATSFVVCRGANDDDQLGRLVFGSYVQISAGDAHTCALTKDAAIFCWGRNAAGQLGTGTRFTERAPGRVVEPEGMHP